MNIVETTNKAIAGYKEALVKHDTTIKAYNVLAEAWNKEFATDLREVGRAFPTASIGGMKLPTGMASLKIATDSTTFGTDGIKAPYDFTVANVKQSTPTFPATGLDATAQFAKVWTAGDWDVAKAETKYSTQMGYLTSTKTGTTYHDNVAHTFGRLG